MTVEILRHYVPVMIDSLEQGIVDQNPGIEQVIADVIMEQYRRVIGSDHGGCVILESGTREDRTPYNVVIQALTPFCSQWFGGGEAYDFVSNVGVTYNFRELNRAGQAVGFVVYLAHRVKHGPVRSDNTYLILHSSEEATMEAIERSATDITNERILLERELSVDGWKDWPKAQALYETTPPHPMPIEGGGPLTAEDEGGPVRTTESLNDR